MRKDFLAYELSEIRRPGSDENHFQADNARANIFIPENAPRSFYMPEMSLTETRAIQWECQELMTTFYRSLDERNFERLLSTMDPDGTWDREGAVLRGHDAIRAAMAVRSKTMVVVHTLSTLQVTVRDSDAADLFAYMACFVSDTGAPPVFPIAMRGPKSVYICRGEFGRRDGRWLITRNWTEGPLFVAAA